jgi:cyclophilin family peptidyl-prolyl cis-trans isomerase/HEAT repeat protein
VNQLRPTSARRLVLAFALLVAPFARPSTLHAQDESVVEQIARVLAAEDARRWDPAAIGAAASSVSPLARSKAALAIGRIGDLRGRSLLLRLLVDGDAGVRADAAFALGLLRDTATVATIVTQLGTASPALDTATSAELVTALTKIGGPAAADFVTLLLERRAPLSVADPELVLRRALAETWRLGRAAPVTPLLGFLGNEDPNVRAAAVYTLGRLRAPAAYDRITAALGDADVAVRENASRALGRGYAEAADRDPGALGSQLAKAVDDLDPRVRINAMRSLATIGDARHAARIVPYVNDPLVHVQAQAVASLAELGGPDAVESLRRVVDSRMPWGARREALVGLARHAPEACDSFVGEWRTSAEWVDRAAAAEAWARRRGGPPAGEPFFLADADARVVAAGLQAWASAVEGPDPRLTTVAHAQLASRDAAVRAVAAEIVGRTESAETVTALAQAYARGARDSFPDAQLAALAAIAAAGAGGDAAARGAAGDFLASTPRPTSYVVRAWAAANWPAAAQRWGAVFPVQTERTLEDYRTLVRAFVVPPDSIANPRVRIDNERGGSVEIELLGRDAPLTVANFLRLVDQHAFDGNRWHRVVPNFVVQDGDPRGDGWGSIGGPIRDEINRRRYESRPMLGMALSGPDTGTSQWFINLGAQPHLDGTYTIFGRVVAGNNALFRTGQGDRIRTIRR